MRLSDGDKLNTRKATGFKSPRINCWKINQVAPKWQIYFLDKTCKKGLKQKERTSPSNFTKSKQSRYQISA